MYRVALGFALLGALAAAAPAHARECGIPDSKPLWVDFAGHDAPLPQKPGLTLAYTSGTEKPAAARAAGAATVFFDLNFNKRVGTPTAPADPATIVEKGADHSPRRRPLWRAGPDRRRGSHGDRDREDAASLLRDDLVGVPTARPRELDRRLAPARKPDEAAPRSRRPPRPVAGYTAGSRSSARSLSGGVP